MTRESAGAASAPSDRCSRCGAPFTCGMQAGLPECWCARLPPLARAPDAAAGCYCPACLASLLAAAPPTDGTAARHG